MRYQGRDLGRGVDDVKCATHSWEFKKQETAERQQVNWSSRQRSDINMSSYNWRDGEICKLLIIMGEKVMQSHLTKTVKDGVIYEKKAAELSLRRFRWDKKQVVSKIKNIRREFNKVSVSQTTVFLVLPPLLF